MIEKNTVCDTRPDASGDPSRSGFWLLESFHSEAEVHGNQLAANPVPLGAVTNSQISAARS